MTSVGNPQERDPFWSLGDRVTREVYLDDGTWFTYGDRCLPGPLKHGAVAEAFWDYAGRQWLYTVRWDDGTTQSGLLWGGLDREVAR